jgi:hypothetical protein
MCERLVKSTIETRACELAQRVARLRRRDSHAQTFAQNYRCKAVIAHRNFDERWKTERERSTQATLETASAIGPCADSWCAD